MFEDVRHFFDISSFVKAFDSDDSKTFAYYLDDSRYWAEKNLKIMLDELDLYQDIAFLNCDLKNKYKYFLKFSVRDQYKPVVDATGATVFYWGIYPQRGYCDVTVDENTYFQSEWGLVFDSNKKATKFKLTFLGIPKFEKTEGIWIDVNRLDEIEIYAKKGLVNDVKKLFEENYIHANRATLKSRIIEI